MIVSGRVISSSSRDLLMECLMLRSLVSIQAPSQETEPPVVEASPKSGELLWRTPKHFSSRKDPPATRAQGVLEDDRSDL